MRLAEKIRQLKMQEEEIQQLRHQRLENERKLMERTMKGIKGGEYLLYKQFEEENYHHLIRKEERKRKTIGEVEGERENLIGLMKERKMLERLKEKRFKKFSYQMEKWVQKSVDEMVIQRHRSSSKEDYA